MPRRGKTVPTARATGNRDDSTADVRQPTGAPRLIHAIAERLHFRLVARNNARRTWTGMFGSWRADVHADYRTG